MNSIKLNFINHSNESSNANIVLFQKNIANNVEELAIAWKVIKNCNPGWHHPFEFPLDIYINLCDAWGNELNTPCKAEHGQLFHAINDVSGTQIKYIGTASSANEVHLVNNLESGSIDANIYKDGKLLASNRNVNPGQKAVFQFKPTLWLGVAPQVEEGQVMNSAILSNINTEISLQGIQSADIIMTGGGPGRRSSPFTFDLENVIMA